MLYQAHYAIGTTLANMTNIEALIGEPAHSLDGNRIPLAGPIRRQTLDNAVQRNGTVNAPLLVSLMAQSAMRTLILDTFGGYSVSSKALYAVAIAENNAYLPFSVTLETPRERDHYTVVNDQWLRDISIPGWNWVVQVATKTNDFTVTASTHYLKADSSSADLTFTLPAAASVPIFVPYTFEKIVSANNMVLDANGAELIAGTTTKTYSANNTIVSIVSNGTSWDII